MEELILEGSNKRQKKEMSVYVKDNSNSNSTVPWDVLTSEILTRLPTKSLIRFKTVFKQWLLTISSLEFANLQLERTNANHHNNNHGLLITITSSSTVYHPVCGFLTYNYNSNNNSHMLNIALDHHIPPPFPEVGYHVMGSCNGLVCLWLFMGLGSTVCFWNPMTRQRLLVRAPSMNLHPDNGVWGFGYIPGVDDYKLVNVQHHSLGGTKGFLVSAYTLRTNNWNQYMSYSPLADITREPQFKAGLSSGIIINNVIAHWLVPKRTASGCFEPCLLTFDMVNESFNDVPLPRPLQHIQKETNHLLCSHFCLSNNKDNLCIIAKSNNVSYSRVVWELICYGDWGSWEEIFKFDVRGGYPGIPLSDLDTISLNTSEEGFRFLLLLTTSEACLIYSSDHQKLKRLRIEGPERAHQVCSHVESLVSPFIGPS